MESLFNMKLNKDNENYALLNDIVRIVTIQVITQFLFCMNNNNISFFNITFIKTVLFICISILIYWLIIRKIINFNLEEEGK